MKVKSVILLVVSFSLFLVLSVSGCSTTSYYAQSISGHSKLMLARISIDKAIERSQDDSLIQQLKLAKQLRRFASTELALPDNKSYQSYVALEREFPVWSVVAAPEFSVEAKQWCYLVIGCAAYRGYFRKDRALEYATKLGEQGYETVVGGVPAYSTLGWFADPLLPSMMRYGETNFAETMFHELAHQRLYIDGDSNFNEAFATVVGERGVILWLQQRRPEELAHYRARLNAYDQFNELVTATKSKLSKLYASAVSAEQKRVAKSNVFSDLRAQYQVLKNEQWQGRDWFARWFETPLNNARLAAFSTYYEQVPQLRRFLDKCDGNLAEFYTQLSRLEESATPVQVPDLCRY